jgi:hypothetical protein
MKKMKQLINRLDNYINPKIRSDWLPKMNKNGSISFKGYVYRIRFPKNSISEYVVHTRKWWWPFYDELIRIRDFSFDNELAVNVISTMLYDKSLTPDMKVKYGFSSLSLYRTKDVDKFIKTKDVDFEEYIFDKQGILYPTNHNEKFENDGVTVKEVI